MLEESQARRNIIAPSDASVVAPSTLSEAHGSRLVTDHIVTPTEAQTWGWLPALSLVSALGLWFVSLADTGARNDATWAELLFWTGLAVLFMPVALRLTSPKPSRRERIGLVVVLGLSFYLVKVLNSPLFLSYHDELLTWRTTNDIVKTRTLFQENPVHPIGPFYPGLATVTAALVSLGNLSIFGAGGVALGVARLVLVLALYLFYEEASRSALVAGIATLLYMTNPNFLFFDAQFSYESLALPFAALTLFAAARRARASDSDAFGVTLVALCGLGAVVVTHHITSYTLMAFLVLWATVELSNLGKGNKPGLSNMALLALVTCLTWLLYVASLTIDYLAPNLIGGVSELLQIIAGEATSRQLFHPFAGNLPPLWERLTASAAVMLIMVGLPFGLLQIWRHYRDQAVNLALALGSLAFPASQILRLTQSGFFAAVRSLEFLFVPVAFVLAVGAGYFWLPRRPNWKWMMVVTGWATVIFVGGVALGRPPWMRLPGPYLVVADTRSIETQGITAAEWVRASLGPGNRIATDRLNVILMGTYGEQRVVTGIADKVPLGILFLSPEVGKKEQTILQIGRIRYIVIDHRLSRGLPMAGYYYQATEPDAYRHATPIDPAILAKFDSMNNVSRIFDSGDIIIYDVGALAREP